MGTYWDSFTDGLFDFVLGAFNNNMQDWLYPIIMLGILGWLYGVTNSLIAVVAGIIVMVGLYGSSVFVDVPDIMFILYIVVLLSIASLLTVLFLKRRT